MRSPDAISLCRELVETHARWTRQYPSGASRAPSKPSRPYKGFALRCGGSSTRRDVISHCCFSKQKTFPLAAGFILLLRWRETAKGDKASRRNGVGLNELLDWVNALPDAVADAADMGDVKATLELKGRLGRRCRQHALEGINNRLASLFARAKESYASKRAT